MKDVVYIAAPYSHPDSSVVEHRMKQLYKVDAMLMRQGHVTVSPLYKHAVVEQEKVPSDWAYWRDYSLALLSRCSKMIVLMMPGWDESEGVDGEIKFCWEHNIPIEYIDPDDVSSVHV